MAKRGKRASVQVAVQSASSVSPRPESVRDAVIMLYASASIGALYVILFLDELMTESAGGNSALAAMLFYTVFTFGLLGALGFFLTRRRNWARWALAGYAALTVLLFILKMPYLLSDAPGFCINCLFAYGLELTALLLLFRRSAADWFMKSPEQRTA